MVGRHGLNLSVGTRRSRSYSESQWKVMWCREVEGNATISTTISATISATISTTIGVVESQ